MLKKFSILLIILTLMISFSVIFAEGETIEITFEDDSYEEYVYGMGSEDALSVKDGVLDVQQQIGVNLAIEPGSLLHYRVKSKTFGEDGPLFMMDLNNSERYEEAFRLYVNNPNDFYIDVLRMDDFANLGFAGKDVISLNEWMDIVFYLSLENEMSIFMFNSNDDSGFLSTTVRLPDEWQDKVWDSSIFIDYEFWHDQFDESEMSLQIDFINYSTLPIESYFDEYLVPARAQEDEIIATLSSTQQGFDSLEFWSYDGGPSEEVQEDLNRDDLNIPINLIHTVVENAQVVFEENAEQMRENQGGEFSFNEEKSYDESGKVFVFSALNEPAYLVFNSALNEIEGIVNESGKGFYLKFKSAAENLRFSFVSSNGDEVGIEFDEDGSPFLFNDADGLMIPFISGETEPTSVKNEEWYHLFFAIDEYSHLKALIWPVDEYLHNGGLADFTFENVEGDAWQFVIQFDSNGQIEVEEYQIYSIEYFLPMFGE